jgi:uncharacterized protein YwgA
VPELIFPDPGEQILSLGDVSPKLFHPHRILALKILSMNDQVEFRELKYDLRTTDGNLATNLRALEEEGLVRTTKRDMPGTRARVFFACLRSMGIEPNIATLGDRKKLQKIAYLLQVRASVDLDAQFTWYLHGPYCKELAKDLFLACNDERMWTQGTPSDLTSVQREKVMSLASFLGEDLKSPDALELLASLDYVRSKAKEAGIEESRAIDVVNLKKPFFSYQEILRCWKKLQQP